MSQKAIQQVERKLQSLKRDVDPKDWADPEFLMEKADQQKHIDPAFSLRILQRVRNLCPDDENIKSRISDFTRKLKHENPDSLTSSSKEAVVTRLETTNNGATALNQDETLTLQERLLTFLRTPFCLAVVIPFLAYAFYQIVWASPRYESQTQLIVKQPDAMSTLDPTMALFSGFTGGSSGTDTELVKAYIYSNDLVQYLQQQLAFSEHFSNSQYDIFSRLNSEPSRENLLKYYKQHVEVEVDDKSSVVTVKVQAFEREFAKQFSSAIVERAEWYINKIGHDMAKAQLEFVRNEHDIIMKKVQRAKSDLLQFQREYNLLDPEAEGVALQQITYGLEAQIAEKNAELRALRNSMSETAPLVLQAKEQLLSLEAQLLSERERLTNNNGSSNQSSDLGVSEILARYSEFKINLEFAMQAYAASQVSLEKSRIEAYRQLKYLVVVEAPGEPEDALYPNVVYNLALFATILLMLFGIGRIIFATVEELK